MLDEALKELLGRRLVAPLKPERDIVTGQRAPLGTFSARVDAAYQLGLISRFMARDLHLIREIRNTFAHYPDEATFNTPSIRDRVSALEQASDYNRRRPEFRVHMGPPGPRGDFLGIAAWMLFSIARKAHRLTPVEPHGAEFGYVDWESLPPDVLRRLNEALADTTEGDPPAT